MVFLYSSCFTIGLRLQHSRSVYATALDIMSPLLVFVPIPPMPNENHFIRGTPFISGYITMRRAVQRFQATAVWACVNNYLCCDYITPHQYIPVCINTHLKSAFKHNRICVDCIICSFNFKSDINRIIRDCNVCGCSACGAIRLSVNHGFYSCALVNRN